VPSVSDAVSTASKGVSEPAQAVSAASQAAAPAVSGAAQAVTAASRAQAITSASHVASVASPLAALAYFIMVPMVYVAVLVLIVGAVWKIVEILRSPAQSYPLTVYPAARTRTLAALRDAFGMRQVREHKPLFWVFLVAFHISFLLLILAHLDIIPGLRMLPTASPHMLGAGSIGVVITVCLLYFMARRFRSPVREISIPGDYLLLLLLLFLFLLGDTISWANSWSPHGFVITKKDFALYFDGLVRFTFANPRVVLHGSHYVIVVLHVLLANLFFIILPFTKIVHTFFTIPINLLRRK